MTQRTDKMYRKLVYFELVQHLLVKQIRLMFSHRYSVRTSSRVLLINAVRKNRQTSRKLQKKVMNQSSGSLSHVITPKTKTKQLLFQKVSRLSLNRNLKNQLSLNSLNNLNSQNQLNNLNRNQKNLSHRHRKHLMPIGRM